MSTFGYVQPELLLLGSLANASWGKKNRCKGGKRGELPEMILWSCFSLFPEVGTCAVSSLTEKTCFHRCLRGGLSHSEALGIITVSMDIILG